LANLGTVISSVTWGVWLHDITTARNFMYYLVEMYENYLRNVIVGVVSSFMAKGALSMDSDQCLFTVGLASGDFANVLLDEADVVLCLGCEISMLGRCSSPAECYHMCTA
jgi:thiamine pyrophosphate-dependent acetolactate synthase large subunit-like protein